MPDTRRLIQKGDFDSVAEQRLQTAEIDKILISAIPCEIRQPGSNRNLLHWRVQGVMSNDRETYLFDTIKDRDDHQDNHVEINYRPGDAPAQSLNHVAGLSTTLLVRMTGQQFINFLYSKGLNHCTYNNAGSGCYTWCRKVTIALEAAGYIAAGSTASLD